MSENDHDAEREATIDPEPSDSPDRAVLGPGTQLGRYRIVGLIGQGGMGAVYEAFDLRLQRPVALKRLATERSADPASRARFWREARVLAALKHPGVVTVHDVDEVNGHQYLVMELVDGTTLDKLIHQRQDPAQGQARGRRLEVSTALCVGLRIAEALGAAHTAGIVHRDIKPGNVLVDRQGAVRVADFGLARRGENSADQVSVGPRRAGTPAYMAPEQVQGDEVGPAADVFSLGTVLYRLLSGVHPFLRETAAGTGLAIAASVHQPLGERMRDLPARVVATVERCLQRDPSRRFADGNELAAQLAELCAAHPPGAEAITLAELVASTRHDTPSDLASGASRLSPGHEPVPPPKRWRPFVAVGMVVVALGVTLAMVATRSSTPTSEKDDVSVVKDTATSSPADTTSPPTVEAAPSPAMPPRPAVVVLDLEADTGLVSRSQVCTEILRIRLDEDPDHIALIPTAMWEAHTAPPLDLVVRGNYRMEAGRERVSLELTRGDGRVIDRLDVAGDSPIVIGEALAVSLSQRLGGSKGTDVVHARLTSQVEAFESYLTARRARYGGADTLAGPALERALALDPGFGLARAFEVYHRRNTMSNAALAEFAKTLLVESDVLPVHDRASLEAMVAWLEGKPEEALRLAEHTTARWHYDIDARYLTMTIRFHDDLTRSFDDVVKVAREVLAIAPSDGTAVSRLLRVLCWRGQLDEAEKALSLAEQSLRKGDTTGAEALFRARAELDFYSGRNDAAAAGFKAVLERQPDQSYAFHMMTAADIVAGRADLAASLLLDRIEHFATLGKKENLDWTYGLGVLALVRGERWDALDNLMERWRHGSVMGKRLVPLFEMTYAPARGVPFKKIATELEDRLVSKDLDPANRSRLVHMLARVGHDPNRLRFWLAEAERTMLDIGSSTSERSRWRLVARLLRARLMGFTDKTSPRTLAAWAEAVPREDEINSEEELRFRAESLATRAEMFAASGQDEAARKDWQALVDSRYGCLWAVDLCLLAQRRLADP